LGIPHGRFAKSKKHKNDQTNERSEVLKRFIRCRTTKPFSPRL
jgi:hypothetical protein